MINSKINTMHRRTYLGWVVLLWIGLLSLGLTQNANGQNLVQNHSFEDLGNQGCPNSHGQLTYADGWLDPNGTTDFFNPCMSCGPSDTCVTGGTCVGVPYNFRGKTLAQDGDAYAGFLSGVKSTHYEYAEIPLRDALREGSCYRISFWVKLSHCYGEAYTKGLGVRFNQGPSGNISISTPADVSDPIERDNALDWEEIVLMYTATGGEDHMAIGGFNQSRTYNVQQYGVSSTKVIYYFLDNVSVEEYAPECLITTDSKPIICPGQNITLNGPANPNGTISYQWQGGPSTQNWTVNMPGIYTLTVTEGECSSTCTYEVFGVTSPAVTLATMIEPTCPNGTDGSISLTVVGGNAPLSYQWFDQNMQPVGGNSHDLIGVGVGAYTVVITDNSGCTWTFGPFPVTEPAIPQGVFSVTTPTCNSAGNGSIILGILGGTAPYSVTMFPNNGSQPQSQGGNSPFTFSGLSAGSFTFQVIDANGCQFAYNTSLTEPNPIIITPTVTNETECDQFDGSITLAVAGGTPNYTYTWVPNVGNTNILTGLAPGTYTVTATDQNACSETLAIDVLPAEGCCDPWCILGNLNAIAPGAPTTPSSHAGLPGWAPGYNYLGTATTHDVVFATNATERMRIVGLGASPNLDGNVGINVQNPGTYRLAMRQFGPSNRTGLQIQNGLNGSAMRSMQLYVGSNAAVVDGEGAASLVLRTGGNNRLLIDNASGNVGIGWSNALNGGLPPSEALHVQGRIRTDQLNTGVATATNTNGVVLADGQGNLDEKLLFQADPSLFLASDGQWRPAGGGGTPDFDWNSNGTDVWTGVPGNSNGYPEGKVGIGLNSPTHKFTVQGSPGCDPFQVRNISGIEALNVLNNGIVSMGRLQGLSGQIIVRHGFDGTGFSPKLSNFTIQDNVFTGTNTMAGNAVIDGASAGQIVDLNKLSVTSTLGSVLFKIESTNPGGPLSYLQTENSSGVVLIDWRANEQRFMNDTRFGANATPGNKVEITADNANESGLRFTNLTSTTPLLSSGDPNYPNIDCDRVLTVDANGDVVLMDLTNCNASTKAMQVEQEAEIDALQARVAQLEALLEQLVDLKAVDCPEAPADGNKLFQNEPNPFYSSTTIRYRTVEDGQVQLVVFDQLGYEASVLINAVQKAGDHQVVWDAEGLPSGVYTYVLKLDGKELARRAIHLN